MHTHTHIHIHIRIYIFGGNLKFLLISQSEGPTKAPDVLLAEMDPGLMVSGASLKIISILPRAIFVQKQKRAMLALMGPWMR